MAIDWRPTALRLARRIVRTGRRLANAAVPPGEDLGHDDELAFHEAVCIKCGGEGVWRINGIDPDICGTCDGLGWECVTKEELLERGKEV